MKKIFCLIIFLLTVMFSVAQNTSNTQEIIIKCPQCGHNIVVSFNVNGTATAIHESDSIASNGDAARCQAMTLKGTQCSRNAIKGSNYCSQHDNMYLNKKSSKTKTDEKSNSTSTTGQCRATTKAGKRCSRPARSNGYCWQHGG